MTAAVVVASWLGVALLLTVVMARRGHDPFQWALLGAVLGPVAVPLAIAHRQNPALPQAGAAPSTEPGRVLVGLRPGVAVDEVAPALAHLRTLAGPVPVTVAAVLDAEACERPSGREAVAVVERFLEAAAAALVRSGVAAEPVERRVLFGDPAAALAAFARDNQCALVAVGAGEPLSRRAVHGSTRSRLLRSATVPVLCVRGHTPRRRSSRAAGSTAQGEDR